MDRGFPWIFVILVVDLCATQLATLEGSSASLLGKQTAETLRVLKVGLNLQSQSIAAIHTLETNKADCEPSE